MTSASLERFHREVRGIWSRLGNVNWSDPSFTVDKAYVAAVFSKIAYLDIPEFELHSHSSAKVIPCLTYQQLVSRRVSVDLKEFLRRLDFGEVIIITRPHVIVVVVFSRDVIFISFRGTRPLYVTDWMIDFHVSRIPTYVNKDVANFHSGFFQAVNSCLDELSMRLVQRLGALNSDVPIYVVGHSLGGAMAAVTHSLAGTTFFSRLGFGQDVVVPFQTHSCYTFGMPRYGDSETTCVLRGPNHIYNLHDVIPGVPPKWLGFEDAPQGYRLSGKGKLFLMPQDSQNLSWWMSRSIRSHFIERYIHELP